MTENILPQNPVPQNNKPLSKNPNVPFVSIILCFILFIVLILFGERVLFDLNKVANPIIIEATADRSVSYNKYGSQMYAYEGSGLSKQRIIYKKDDKSSYRVYKLIIHSSFIIPVFLLIFLFYYLYHLKKANPNVKAVLYAYIGFAFWMMLRLLIETAAYIIDQFENAAVYIILGVLIAVITPLAIFIQKKVNQNFNKQTNQQ